MPLPRLDVFGPVPLGLQQGGQKVTVLTVDNQDVPPHLPFPRLFGKQLQFACR
jgi:hypothetical protein